MEFGELKDVELRTVWPDEAHDFTPWLANNLGRLSQVIGIPLGLEDREVSVGRFSADIVATTSDSSDVVVENQYGQSDHDHLGKVLTYLVGREAETVIWISERFREEHLDTIRWLNDNTAERFSFLAVKASVKQIADSPMAPIFEVLARPSNWEHRIKQLTQSDALSDSGRFRRDFWSTYAGRYPDDGVSAGATSNQWVYVEEADLNISLALVRNKVGLFLRGNRGENVDVVRERISAYEAGFRRQFPHWPENELIYDCVEWSAATNTHDCSNWPQMADWLHEHLEIYRGILTQDTA